MSTDPKTLLTEEQYLELERRAEFKSEYYQGEMFAMAGAEWVHNRLVANTVAQFTFQFRSLPCQVVPSDMRVRVSATGLYTYLDVVVVCGDPQFLDERRDTLFNPSLIVEVLSPSTEGYDRGRKFEHYRSIPSLKEYLLIASDRVHVDLHALQPDGHWVLYPAGGLSETIELTGIGCKLALTDLYNRVDIAPWPPS